MESTEQPNAVSNNITPDTQKNKINKLTIILGLSTIVFAVAAIFFGIQYFTYDKHQQGSPQDCSQASNETQETDSESESNSDKAEETDSEVEPNGNETPQAETDEHATTDPDPTIRGATYMQDVTANMAAATEIGTTTQLKDKRDGTIYTVAKMPDNKIWMLDNLALDLTNNDILNSLTASNTDIDETNDPNALAALKGTAVRNPDNDQRGKYATAKAANWSWSSYSAPLISMDYKDIIPQGINDPLRNESLKGNWKVGGYYNYCAASAGSYCYGDKMVLNSAGTFPSKATSSICPKGWHLPTSYTDGEFANLYNQYNNGKPSQYIAFRIALHLPLSGYTTTGSQIDQGNQGGWQGSSTNSKQGDVTYILNSYTYDIGLWGAGNRYYGYTIRCVLNS